MSCSGCNFCDYATRASPRAAYALTLRANCLHCGRPHVSCSECAVTRTTRLVDCGVETTWFTVCPVVEQTLSALEG